MPLISAVLFVLTAGAAQPREDAIVVTGKRGPAEVEQAIHQVAAAPVDDQFARWKAPLCIGTVGVPKAIGARVVARVEAVAREAGVALAKTPCKRNAFITFTSDGSGLAKTFRRKERNMFAYTSLDEYKLLMQSNLPIRWWYGYETTGSDGSPVTDGAAAIGLNASGTDGINLGPRVTMSYSSSLIETKFNTDVIAATVVVDVTRATGKSLDAVADYAARVIIGPTRLPVTSPDQPTILTLFEDASGTERLTRFDRAYLWALYKLPASRTAWIQRGRLAALVAERMAKE